MQRSLLQSQPAGTTMRNTQPNGDPYSLPSSSIDEHLSHLWFGDITNKIAVHIRVQIFVWTYAVISLE